MTTLNKIVTLCLVAFSCILLTGCFSAQKALNKNQYDKAINKTVKKLKGKNNKDKHILILEEAYAEAVKLNLHNIEKWESRGLINNWKKVLQTYRKLANRQHKVQQLLPLYIAQEARPAEFEINDYNSKIAYLKDNVSEYLYRTANVFLEENNKQSARKAYEVLCELNKLKSGYKDAKQLQQIAFAKGKNHVLIAVENRYGPTLPYGIEKDLVNLNINGKGKKWVVFHNSARPYTSYDFVMEIDLNRINVSTDRLDENISSLNKKVEDGWEFKLDKRNNFVKDSLGNKIKVKKYKLATCDFVEARQFKEASMAGLLNIYDNKRGILLDAIPVSGTSTFEHTYTSANGDYDALSAEQRRKIKKSPKPFPNDFQMLEDAIDTMRPALKDAIEDKIDLVLY